MNQVLLDYQIRYIIFDCLAFWITWITKFIVFFRLIELTGFIKLYNHIALESECACSQSFNRRTSWDPNISYFNQTGNPLLHLELPLHQHP